MIEAEGGTEDDGAPFYIQQCEKGKEDQVILRHLITADEAEIKSKLDNITELEKKEIDYVLSRR